MKRILVLFALFALFATPVFADLTVDDRGWEVTVTSGDGRSFAQKDNGHKVAATPPDSHLGFAVANQKAALSSQGLGKALDTVVGSGMLCAPRPATVTVPLPWPQPCASVYRPLPAPCAPCQPTRCQPPAGGQNVRWATIHVTWQSDGNFRSVVDGRSRLFIIPSQTKYLFRHRPNILSGWLYNCPRQTGCPLVLRESTTCMDFRDP